MFEFLIKKLKAHPRKIVFTEGSDPRILEASARLLSGTFLTPVLVGDPEEIQKVAEEIGFNIRGAEIINPATFEDMEKMVAELTALRKGKVTEEQARELGIAGMVTFTGAVPHEELPPYLALCDVYVTASLSDTNSISMLEGEAAGLPVLQRLDPLNADQVVEGRNGFLFNSPEELGRKLRLVRDMAPEELAALKDRVTRFVKDSGAETLANYTLSVYHTIYKDRAEDRGR